VLKPDLGDVTGLLVIFSQLVLFIATVFSGLMAYLADGSDSGPATQIQVEGDYYVLDFSGDEHDVSDVMSAVSNHPQNQESDSEEPDGGGETQSDVEAESAGQS